MKKLYGCLALAVCGGLLGQVMRPNGATKTVTDHKVDLGMCDYIKLEVPARDVQIYDGKLTLHAWKKYGVNMQITCEVEKRLK